MRERNWLDNIGVPVDPWVDKLLQRDDFDRLLAVARAAEEYTRHGVQHPSWCQRSIAGLPCDCGLENLREKLKGSSGLET
jgi:hypothetical protein